MFRALNAVFAGLFFLGAVVQYNDPDPVRWMLVYLAAAAACLLAVSRRLRWPTPATVALVALVWAAMLAPSVLGRVEMGELVSAWEMKDARVEEGREMYGLMIVGSWMSLLAVVEWRRGRSTVTSEHG